MDIMGIILQAIGGQKLLQVGSVFAEGANITRQAGFGGIGINSFLNQIPALQNIMNTSGLAGVFSNPVSSITSQLNNAITAAIPTIGAITTTTTSSGSNGNTTTTTSATFPQFTSALNTAAGTINKFYYWTQLMSGQLPPNYMNNEYGLSDILNASSSGLATLSSLTLPLSSNPVINTAYQQLQTLIQAAQNKQVSDASAVSQLSAILAPVVTALVSAQATYQSATTTSSQSTQLSMILDYAANPDSPESSFLSSLMDNAVFNQVQTVISQQQTEMESNTAAAQISNFNLAFHDIVMVELHKALFGNTEEISTEDKDVDQGSGSGNESNNL